MFGKKITCNKKSWCRAGASFCHEWSGGLDEAVHGVYPKAEIQHCIVHKVRSSIKNFGRKI